MANETTAVKSNMQAANDALEVISIKVSKPMYAAIGNVTAQVFGEAKLARMGVEKREKFIANFFRECALKGIVSKRNSKLTGEYNAEARDVDALVDDGMSRQQAEIEVWGISGTLRRTQLATAKAAPLV